MAGPMLAGPMLLRALAVGVLVTIGACAGPTSASQVTLSDGTTARIWGDGDYGLVLVHDAGTDAAAWQPQATAFAEERMTVLAVELAEPETVVAAIGYLRDTGRVERVALLGAGAGSEAALAVGRQSPQLVDQLIVISASGEVASLGQFPKLFVASEGEAAAAEAARMAEEAPGDWNALYLAPGATSGQAIFSGEGGAATLEAVLRRLEERR